MKVCFTLRASYAVATRAPFLQEHFEDLSIAVTSPPAHFVVHHAGAVDARHEPLDAFGFAARLSRPAGNRSSRGDRRPGQLSQRHALLGVASFRSQWPMTELIKRDGTPISPEYAYSYCACARIVKLADRSVVSRRLALLDKGKAG